MQSFRLFRQLIVRQAPRRNYGGGHHEVQTTLNDLPSPNGSWQVNYDAMQRRYNVHLLVGIATLLGTIGFGKAAGFFEFYNEPPERPADIESYK